MYTTLIISETISKGMKELFGVMDLIPTGGCTNHARVKIHRTRYQKKEVNFCSIIIFLNDLK